MAANEEQLIALTFINSFLDSRKDDQEAIIAELGERELIKQLAEISVILAMTLSTAVDPENPTSVKQLIEDLRGISNKY